MRLPKPMLMLLIAFSIAMLVGYASTQFPADVSGIESLLGNKRPKRDSCMKLPDSLVSCSRRAQFHIRSFGVESPTE